MKRLILLALLTLSITSCDWGEEVSTQYVLGPVQDVTMAETYAVDSISEILVRYARPDNCHMWNGFYYLMDGDTRTVAIEYAKMNRSDCTVDEDPVFEVPLYFKPQHSGTYLFRFWDGVNDDGSDHFYETEVVVPD